MKERRRRLPLTAALVTAIGMAALIAGSVALAFDSGGNPGGTGPNTITWTGQGVDDEGNLNTEICPTEDDLPDGIDPNSYLHFVMNTDGGSVTADGTTPVLHLSGSQTGDYLWFTKNGANSQFQWFVPYSDPLTLDAYASINVIAAGGGSWNLVISHGCSGERPPADALSVNKDASGSYDDTFEWDIDKSADTARVFSAGGGPSGAVNYTVSVSHGESQVSNVKVSGTIDVTNPNGGAVTLDDVTDSLSDNTPCTVDTSAGMVVPANSSTSYPYECDLAGVPSGDLTNTATASWSEQDLSDGSTLAAGSAPFTTGTISFTGTEIDECTTVNDTNPNGPQGVEVCADDANPTEFNYSETFEDEAGTCTEHENTASFVTSDRAATDSAKTTVEDCQGADLTVSKTANPSFDLKYVWDIDKSADTARVFSAGGGESGAVNYTVSVSHDAGTPSNWKVTGKITVSNPNDWQAVTLADLTDAIDNGGVCTVDKSAGLEIPASGSKDYPYECTYASAPAPAAGTNTATATWDKDAYHTPNGSDSGDAAADFGAVSPSVVDECTDVSDTLQGSLGTVCVGDANPTAFNYKLTFTDPEGTCTEHKNTASATTNDTKTEVKSDEVTVEDCQGADLTVSKTATPSFTRAYDWTIDKSVTQSAPGSKTFDYTVVVEHNAGIDSNWKVTGKITVSNPNDWQDIVADISDSLPGGDCSVTGGEDVNVPAEQSVSVDYSCTFASNPGSGTNTATATWDAAAAHTLNGSASDDADFTFGDPTSLVDECIDVKDDNGTPANTADDKVLGQVCVGDPNPKTFTYSKTLDVKDAQCVTYTNTASYTTTDDDNDTDETASDSETVSYCSPATIGYWKTHIRACATKEKIGKDGCNNNGPFAVQFLPQSLGNYVVDTGLKALAVFNANNCASSTDQDAVACLAAQLLGAKLNVAFGSPNCINSTIGDADAFLISVNYTGPSGIYTLTAAQRAQAISLKTALDNYNKGLGCPI